MSDDTPAPYGSGAGRFRHHSGGIEPEAIRVRLLGGFGVSVGSRTVEESRWRLKKAGSLVEESISAARGALGEAAFEAAFSKGQAMSPEQAIEYALTHEEEPPQEEIAAERPALTGREEEIAALVARGLTNRLIAEELSISERTVDTHVARIFKKLALRSREQVAGYLERRHHEAG